ncbi:MAG: stage II sporulation protein M [Lactobacillales bacterium]|nr:stage II sporulation protein M [Lactobacillales bacterium]
MNIQKLFKKELFICGIISIIIGGIAFYIGWGFSSTFSIDAQKPNYSVLDIFLNNEKVSLLIIIGVFSLGLIDIALLIYNFFIFGASIHFYADEFGIKNMLLKILPHGIVEIPSIFLASAFGFLLLYQLVKKNSNFRWKDFIFQGVEIMVITGILNFIAAFIEGTVSMNL